MVCPCYCCAFSVYLIGLRFLIKLVCLPFSLIFFRTCSRGSIKISLKFIMSLSYLKYILFYLFIGFVLNSLDSIVPFISDVLKCYFDIFNLDGELSKPLGCCCVNTLSSYVVLRLLSMAKLIK